MLFLEVLLLAGLCIAILRYSSIALGRPDAMRIEQAVLTKLRAGAELGLREVDLHQADWISGPMAATLTGDAVHEFTLDGVSQIKVRDGHSAHRLVVICSDCAPRFYAVTLRQNGTPRLLPILDRLVWRAPQLGEMRELANVRLANMNRGRDWRVFIEKRIKTHLARRAH